jgi:hypothetical protein
MKRFQYESRVSLNNLLDKLLGTTLRVGSNHGLQPDYATVKEMRRGLKKTLINNLADEGKVEFGIFSNTERRA